MEEKIIFVYENWSGDIPIPYGDSLSLNVREDDNSISKELVLDVARYFDIERDEAMQICEDICETVRANWESIAKQYGLSRAACERMRTAFESV